MEKKSTATAAQLRPSVYPLPFGSLTRAGHVMRCVQALSADQLGAVIAFARSMVGTRYSFTGAAKSVLVGIAPGRRQFCSRLVGQAYREGGVLLVRDPDFCHPGDLLRSSLLTEVPNALIDLTDETANRRTGETQARGGGPSSRCEGSKASGHGAGEH